MKITDWLGNEYGIGDRVLYVRGEGPSMAVGTVTDIWRVYRTARPSGWWSHGYERLEMDEEIPIVQHTGEWNWEKRKRDPGKMAPAITYLRVKIQPEGSSYSKYTTSRYVDGKWVDGFPIRQVVVQKTENITAFPSYVPPIA